MDRHRIEMFGEELYKAFLSGRTIPNLRDRDRDIGITEAYKIQEHFVAQRLAAGETVVGKKIGATSRAVQEAIGVFEPDFGILTSGMLFPDGAEIDLSRLIQPKAEAEIAFILSADLTGADLTAADVLAATDHIRACFEIVDSRITGWDIKIQDTVADNASCGVFLLGNEKVDPRDVDLALAGMVLERGGEPVSTGVGAAVQGSPLNSVAWLANRMNSLGTPCRAGDIILSGALGPMVTIADGDHLVARIGGIGTCSATFLRKG